MDSRPGGTSSQSLRPAPSARPTPGRTDGAMSSFPSTGSRVSTTLDGFNLPLTQQALPVYLEPGPCRAWGHGPSSGGAQPRGKVTKRELCRSHDERGQAHRRLCRHRTQGQPPGHRCALLGHHRRAPGEGPLSGLRPGRGAEGGRHEALRRVRARRRETVFPLGLCRGPRGWTCTSRPSSVQSRAGCRTPNRPACGCFKCSSTYCARSLCVRCFPDTSQW